MKLGQAETALRHTDQRHCAWKNLHHETNAARQNATNGTEPLRGKQDKTALPER